MGYLLVFSGVLGVFLIAIIGIATYLIIYDKKAISHLTAILLLIFC
jgi:hypothetical protein